MVATQAEPADIEDPTGQWIALVAVAKQLVFIDILGAPEDGPATELYRAIEQERVSPVAVLVPGRIVTSPGKGRLPVAVPIEPQVPGDGCPRYGAHSPPDAGLQGFSGTRGSPAGTGPRSDLRSRGRTSYPCEGVRCPNDARQVRGP